MHDVTHANQPRTNNVSEGWNNKFQALVEHNHPTEWKLVKCIQAECARVCGILLQDERGILPKKKTTNVYVELQIRLHRLIGSILHGVDPLSYFSFQPVLHDWCNKGRGMCHPVCGMMHIKNHAAHRKE